MDSVVIFLKALPHDARADAIFATLKAIVDDIVDDIVTCGRAFNRWMTGRIVL